MFFKSHFKLDVWKNQVCRMFYAIVVLIKVITR